MQNEQLIYQTAENIVESAMNTVEGVQVSLSRAIDKLKEVGPETADDQKKIDAIRQKLSTIESILSLQFDGMKLFEEGRWQ